MSNAIIPIRCAYISVGYKSQYSSSAVKVAVALTTAEEADKSDDELVAIAQSRIDDTLESIRAEHPHYNVFKTDIRIGEVAVKNPAHVAGEDNIDDEY